MKKTIYADYRLINSAGEESIENRLESMLASGVDEVFVQPVLMTDGFEAKKLRRRVSAFEGRFSKIEFGTAVLENEDSIKKFVDLLALEIDFTLDLEYCLVGHGSSVNREYKLLSKVLHSRGFTNVEVCCLAGDGNTDQYLEKIKKKYLLCGTKKAVHVFPLLINMGVHMEQDIFGMCGTGEKSFAQKLEDAGFKVVKNSVPLSHLKTFKDWYLDEGENKRT